jgi:hypothetical protein
LRHAEADPKAAADVLLLASEYLETGQRMPIMLADFIAGAFKSAALKPREYQAKALTDELFLTANNKRRARIDWLDAYDIVQRMPNATSNMQAEALVAHSANIANQSKNDAWSIGKTKADELIKEAKTYIEKEEAARKQ